MIKKCECGSAEFYVHETIIHKGSIDPDDVYNKLTCSGGEAGGIDRVVCVNCHKKWDDDRNEVDFDIELN